MLHFAEVETHVVEEQSSLCFGGEHDQVGACTWCELAVDVFQVCGLATETSAIVDNLACDFSLGNVNHRHTQLLGLAAFGPPTKVDNKHMSRRRRSSSAIARDTIIQPGRECLTVELLNTDPGFTLSEVAKADGI